jgi:uncharacterized protein (TIGR02145 family)
MKKILLLILFAVGGFATAQVKLGSNPSTLTSPTSTTLELEGETKALILNRVTNVSAITNPVNGMIVYDVLLDCYRGYQNGRWTDCGFQKPPEVSTGGSAIVSSYGAPVCTANSITGVMNVASPVSGVTMNLYANVTQLGTYNIVAEKNGITFAGTGTFTFLGCQLITLTGAGTPTTAGTNTFVTNTTPSVSLDATVANSISITSLNCTPAFIPANATSCTDYSGTKTATYTGGNGVAYGTATYQSTGVAGLTLSLTAGTLANGSGTLNYTCTGTPITSGTASFAVVFAGQSCTVNLPVGAAIVPTNSYGDGSFGGKTCFDVALTNDNANFCGPLSSRIFNQSNFSLTATNTQVYTFTPATSVYNVRFAFINTNGTPIIGISGGNTSTNITASQLLTVYYNPNLNNDALGKTAATALTADIYVIYNVTAGGATQQLKLTTVIKDGMCCGAFVSSTAYKVFDCFNLGATTTNTDPNVAQQNIHGNFYQWGRSTAAAGPTTAAGAITGWSVTDPGTTAWNVSTKTNNDPCPEGYRVPDDNLWSSVITNNNQTRTGSWANDSNFTTATHFGKGTTKTLTLPATGIRSSTNGALTSRGSIGYYWSAEPSSSSGYYFQFDQTTISPFPFPLLSRQTGMAVRCVQMN